MAQTGRLLSLLVSALFGEMIPQRFALAHFLLRKAGHFLGYSILSLLAFRAAAATFPFPLLPAFRAGGAIAALSVAFTFAFACLDEWHQGGLACRTGSFADVLLDSVGGLCAAVRAGYVARRGRTLAAPS